MYGVSSSLSISNQSFAYSTSTVPAKGLQVSRFFTLLTIVLPSLTLGSNKIDLLPRALGPDSLFPCAIATILPSDIRVATSFAVVFFSDSPESNV